ncbi:MAG: 4Fe-4S binding protein [Candidatus Helarchaeota archaeon]|nr:4Fe-4S binding protein [Candidatus Helarchaeota archaeon]
MIGKEKKGSDTKLSLRKGVGIAFLIIGIFLVIFFWSFTDTTNPMKFFWSFTDTTNPMKYIFLIAGIVCIIISIVSFSNKLPNMNTAMKFSKVPLIKRIFMKIFSPSTGDGITLPINLSLTYENQTMPIIVLEHFFNKASHIFLMARCGCRAFRNCQNHDQNIGCTWVGSATTRIDVPPEIGGFITKDEALEHARMAIENGLVPTIGRLRGESWIMDALPDEGHFLSLCYCCPCCCILGSIQYANKDIRGIFKRMEGISVEVDRDLCVGCEACTELCIWGAVEVIEGKAEIDRDKCMGCGRCERKCAKKAITIKLEDPSYIDKVIKRIESHVDVTGLKKQNRFSFFYP